MFFGLTLSNVVTYFIVMCLYICCPAYKRFISSCLCCTLTCRCPTLYASEYDHKLHALIKNDYGSLDFKHSKR